MHLAKNTPPLDAHLTYCLNIHKGEHLSDHQRAISAYATEVHQNIAPDQSFGLGLRLGIESLPELADLDRLAQFKDELDRKNLYAFTVNAFPYGTFHGTRVKEQVYAPDWRSPERVSYTNAIADALRLLLPTGQEGSISTVPCSFKPWIETDADIRQLVERITETVIHLHRIHEEHGILIHLGLEPEPACYLETTPEFITFFNDHMLLQGKRIIEKQFARGEEILRRHLGINFDCCHMAIQYENLSDSLETYISEGILLSKIHISAALHLSEVNYFNELKPYEEPVYLHQVKAKKRSDASILSWTDLPEAFEGIPEQSDLESARIHFHVPLFWEGDELLSSTAACMDERFWKHLRNGVSKHLEIETYTFDVLPRDLQRDNVVDSIADEYRWVLDKLSTPTNEST